MPVASASRRVFISYRRQESSGLAGRLYDRLAAHLGDDQVFMDVDGFDDGVGGTREVHSAVSSALGSVDRLAHAAATHPNMAAKAQA